jgi:hypothetical protein
MCPPGRQLCNGSCVIENNDPANCGACGNACAAGELCLLGSCVPESLTVVESGVAGTVAIAVDGTTVFFVDGAGVHAAPASGGGPFRKLADGTGKPLRVAVDGTYAYWSENLGGAIMRAPKDGSGSPSLVAAATQPQGLVVVGSTVYWVSNVSGDGTIYQAPAGGGTPSRFATPAGQVGMNGLQEIVTDGQSLYVANDQCPYRVPILPDGTAGSPVGLTHEGVLEEDGVISGRPNDFCGMWSGLSGEGINCQKGGWGFVHGANEFPGPFVLPSCGLVYSMAGAPNSNDFVTYLVADRDFYSANLKSPRVTLTTDPISAPLVTDGSSIYFLDLAGDIRRLPIP